MDILGSRSVVFLLEETKLPRLARDVPADTADIRPGQGSSAASGTTTHRYRRSKPNRRNQTS